MSAKVNVHRHGKGPVRPSEGQDVGNDTIAPSIDIYEVQDGWRLVADMPGLSKEELDVHVERGVLTISGPFAVEPPEGRPVYGGFPRADYFRSLALSDEIDRASVSASLNNGVLTVTLPRAEAAATRKIEVQAGE